MKNWNPLWRQGFAIASTAFAVAFAAGNLSAAVPAFEAADIRIPVMNSNRTATITTLTAARVSSEHQRFGAISVKLLPRVVAEGVVLDIIVDVRDSKNKYRCSVAITPILVWHRGAD